MCKLKPLLARWLDEADATNSGADLTSTSTVAGALQSSLDRLGARVVTSAASSGVATGCGPHRAALARGGKGAKNAEI